MNKSRTLKKKVKGGQHLVYLDICKGCLLCKESCPFGAISPSPKDPGLYNTPSISVDGEKCTLCGICEQICPDCAIKIKRT